VVEAEGRRFDQLREHSIGLPRVLFQSIARSEFIGIAVTILVVMLRPSRLADVDGVYVEDEGVGGTSPVA
jgi:hypothetical protein